jgi:glycosyltransferase involved in cell wall biosynthesis
MSGPSLVIYSQAQALLDLGFEVEIVALRSRPNHPSQPGACPTGIDYAFLDATRMHPSRLARACDWAGWPRDLAWQRPFPWRRLLVKEAATRIARDSEALHVFNYLSTANAIPSLAAWNTIYVCHDIESDLLERSIGLDVRVENRSANSFERRAVRRLRWIEEEVAARSGVILCVSASDAQHIQERWRLPHATYVPIGIPHAETPPAIAAAKPGDALRIAHVGGLDHLPTFLSLEFLLTRVFPLLDASSLERIHLEVVGNFDASAPRVQTLIETARAYPHVTFSGFVKEIRDVYARSDIQAVAATEATGVRTRIIESWAYGMPIVSTTAGAGGVEGLNAGVNILIANEPREFADALTGLLRSPERLAGIATAARHTYEEIYGRERIATLWRELLNRHLGMGL